MSTPYKPDTPASREDTGDERRKRYDSKGGTNSKARSNGCSKCGGSGGGSGYRGTPSTPSRGAQIVAHQVSNVAQPALLSCQHLMNSRIVLCGSSPASAASLGGCIYMYKCICMHTRTHAQAHSLTHTHTHMNLYVCMYVCMYMYIYMGQAKG